VVGLRQISICSVWAGPGRSRGPALRLDSGDWLNVVIHEN